MLTSKQRASLRGLANTMPAILHIGKDGINEGVIKQAYDALEARELIKGQLIKNAPLPVREAVSILCEKLGAEPVQVIGNRFVIYRKNDKEPKIEL